ncbi:MAG: hypothetical protein IJ774_05785 [Selenomonadaceae bacterium]|nr:hypothetical protein [Selenomonadaceae bacterium]MBR1805886.1 hypothetical protein [Selenomonadaceae bacterium]
MGETARERNGWRDEGISRRHRLWGVECQMTDLDFPVLEYYCEHRVVRPVAIIEYKNDHAKRDDNLLPYGALRQISDCANLPFFVVRYSSDFKNYLVIAMNKWGELRLSEKERAMTEETYIRFLYYLRGYGAHSKEAENAITRLHSEEIRGQPTLFPALGGDQN